MLQAAGAIVQFDLAQRVKDTLSSLPYNATFVSAGVTKICGTRFYTPVSRLEVLSGSQQAQNITYYGQVMNMVTNLRYNVADKIGSTISLGYKLEGDAKVMTQQGIDGCSGAQNGVFPLFRRVR